MYGYNYFIGDIMWLLLFDGNNVFLFFLLTQPLLIVKHNRMIVHVVHTYLILAWQQSARHFALSVVMWCFHFRCVDNCFTLAPHKSHCFSFFWYIFCFEFWSIFSGNLLLVKFWRTLTFCCVTIYDVFVCYFLVTGLYCMSKIVYSH